MQNELQQRLEELKKEFETGQKRLRDLEIQETQLRETMLRISGAIQVLEELLAKGQSDEEKSEPLAKKGKGP